MLFCSINANAFTGAISLVLALQNSENQIHKKRGKIPFLVSIFFGNGKHYVGDKPDSWSKLHNDILTLHEMPGQQNRGVHPKKMQYA